MLSSDICKTLLAVEEVELSFERTLRNINNIQHRYNMVSSMKRKAMRAKESFEAEIQAAITKPTPTKVTNLTRKSLKKKKILPLIPLPVLEPIPYEEYVPETICIRATTYQIHSTETQIVARKPYTDLIRRLYRAARWKTQQEARDQQDLEQSPDCFMCSCSCSSC
ncbi:hypothetical protein KR054_004326 [Drosophila jambulina]|nr:hypothetical protein KR054_004326 [Drosophila jambulina]